MVDNGDGDGDSDGDGDGDIYEILVLELLN